MLDTTRRHLAIFDEWIGRLVAKGRAEGLSIPCRKGCAACCYDVTEVAHFELAPLIERLRAMSPERLDEIERRLGGWRQGMITAGLDPLAYAPDLVTYHRARLACPLLDAVTHECTVYEDRPFSCRGHYLVNQEPAVCSNRAEVPSVQTLTIDEGMVPIVGSLARHFVGAGDELVVMASTLQGMLLAVWHLVRDPSLSVEQWMRGVGER